MSGECDDCGNHCLECCCKDFTKKRYYSFYLSTHEMQLIYDSLIFYDVSMNHEKEFSESAGIIQLVVRIKQYLNLLLEQNMKNAAKQNQK